MSLSPPPSYRDAVAPASRTGRRDIPQVQSAQLDSGSSPHPHAASALEPRVAVLLGVGRQWYLPLLLIRACSVAPGAYWCFRCMWALIWAFVDGFVDAGPRDQQWDFDNVKLVLELSLAGVWSASAASLAYFFADSLMSRWLLNYTPPATLVRLFALNAVNVYAVAWIMHIARATEEPSHLLPAWIFVATTFTALYRVANRSTNIKRETSKAIVVFSLASYTSMCALLALLHMGPR